MSPSARTAALALLAACAITSAAAESNAPPAPAMQTEQTAKSAQEAEAASKTGAPENQASGTSKRIFDHPRDYTHTSAGFGFKIPAFYRSLDPAEEQPRIAQGLAPLFVTGPGAIGRATLRNFRGPADPKQPEKPAPEFRVASGGTMGAFDAGKLEAYRSTVETHLKAMNIAYKDLDVALRDVAGGSALRVAYQVAAGPVAGDRFLAFVVPGPDRSFELDFEGPQGEDGADVQLVLSTFKFQDRAAKAAPPPEEERISPWPRVAWWTGGCFAAGVLLHLLYRLVMRLAGRKTEAA